MSQIAFYAPLKPPDHPNPSGDRLIANLFMKALAEAGHDVRLASRFRSHDSHGNEKRQNRMIKLGETLARRLIRQWEKQGYRPDAWFTYHLYYKAPDLIGPHISRHYSIPYLVAEASWAGKRAQGPWHNYHLQLEQALLQADAIITINPHDAIALRRFLPDSSHLVNLPPFLDIAAIKKASELPLTVKPEPNRLITIAMMRPGDKLHSYQLLVEALQYVDQPFQWFMVGDGKERQTVEQLFKGDPRIHFTGQLNATQVHKLLSECELHVWPAVNEAFGMALLEAQYQHVAILSGDEGGVKYVVADGKTGQLVKPRDPKALGTALNHLLTQPDTLHGYRQQARAYVEAQHSLTQAALILSATLSNLLHKEHHNAGSHHPSPRAY
uniref:Glycosyl transferase family 1 domain-containing protein n=1 Tax=uncultured Thiotrichaceae bacterium TaxID=298394 RepID=A0A6S6UIJ4_9GAMM|nr:MAG: Unknown protein [uncultured Thiotrichaceae bacterium]